MAEAWGQTPETILTMRRGPLWAARWACYRQELAAIERGASGGGAAPLDGEPEWLTLERARHGG